MLKKITLGNYPYAATRVKVLKSLLLKRADYSKLLKMELPEIAAFLQQTNYKKEINELGLKHADAELIERALNRNFAGTARKLLDITVPYPDLQMVVSAYLKKLDVYNLKQLLRGVYAQLSEEDIMNTVLLHGGIPTATLRELAKKGSVQAIAMHASKSDAMKAAIKKFEDARNLGQIENVLDMQYYKEMQTIAKQIQGNTLIARYVKKEIDMLNAKLLLRLSKEGFAKKEILDSIQAYGRDLTRSKIEELVGKPFDEVVKAFQTMKIGKEITESFKQYAETTSLVPIEAGFDKVLLKRSSLFLHEKPLSANPIIGFMIAKEIEIRNIRMIVRSKQHKLPEQFMERQLIAL